MASLHSESRAVQICNTRAEQKVLILLLLSCLGNVWKRLLRNLEGEGLSISIHWFPLGGV